MRKFIRRKKIDEVSTAVYCIDVSKEKNLKPSNLVDIGTKAKLLFNDVNFLPSEKQEKFRKDCLEFY